MKYLVLLFLAFLNTMTMNAQVLNFAEGWKFKTGDDKSWSNATLNDADWKPIRTTSPYELQGYDGYNGYSWYRKRFVLSSALKTNAFLKDSIRILLGKIDDCDQVFWNGKKIAQTGSFPDEKAGYQTAWTVDRRYTMAEDDAVIKWDQENVIAIRVYDGNGGGGIYEGAVSLDMIDLMDYIKLNTTEDAFTFGDGYISKSVILSSSYAKLPISGTLNVEMRGKNKIYYKNKFDVYITDEQAFVKIMKFPKRENAKIVYTFKETLTGKTTTAEVYSPYILTPKESLLPQINGAKIYANRPNRPFLFQVPISGERPLNVIMAGLPKGLTFNPQTGFISGVADVVGEYDVAIVAENAKGKAASTLKISIGDKLCATPPMGWNSWNCWGLTVNDERVRAAAQAMVETGLSNHGWTYINIDDGWEANQRGIDGSILSNEKFPNMFDLCDNVHDKGLKIGIYSSPGDATCGNFLGSYKHEASDAKTYADWGIDYLKYDWCSYANLVPAQPSLAEMKAPYALMRDELKKQKRDIVYSLCQYGMGDVWKWGSEVGGQLWRTTGDISDNWESLSGIGFGQEKSMPSLRPYAYNDVDMLIVGRLGWGNTLRQTKLTPSEQYTHISLWSLYSAPLLLGCDLERLDDFTKSLLTNDEVLAIDQDMAVKPPVKVCDKDKIQVWVKPLSDKNAYAVGVFNLNDNDKNVTLNWAEILSNVKGRCRDVWRQKDIGILGATLKTEVYAHGVQLYKVQ